jgi:MATE family multidrug resistance protein
MASMHSGFAATLRRRRGMNGIKMASRSSKTFSVPSGTWGQELFETVRLAWPLVIAQVAGILLFTTDVVMMGWLGPTQLAAGSLATSLLHPVFLGCLGVVTATAPLIAQAIGARQTRSVRRTVRQGFWVSLVLTILSIPVLLNAEKLYLLLGQEPELAALAQGYLNMAIGVMLPGLCFIALRSLLQAKGDTHVILAITIAGIFVNAAGNYVLMFGNFGFPRLELVGAGISTSIVNWVMFLLGLAYVLLHRRHRRYHVLVRLWKPDWQCFFELFRIGIPIGLSLMSEVGLFGVATIMMGWLGHQEVAAHAITLQCAAIAFMVPLGISQATVVRVGLYVGARNFDGVTKAGWVSFVLSLLFMSATCALFILFPEYLVRLFLDPARPENQTSLMLAGSYLIVAALFQFVDGAQVCMGSALRGMSDTKVPMVIALVGYWLVGVSTAYVAGFIFDLRGVGVWIGLATGLAFAAVLLTLRFMARDRLGLIARANRLADAA